MNDNKKITMNNLLLKENFDSVNLWHKINLLTEQQINIISRGLEWTTVNFKDAVLVGGSAVVNYVTNERQLTPDLDFMITDIWSVKTKLNSDNIRFKDLNPGTEKPIGIFADGLNCDFLDWNVGNKILHEFILRTFNVAIIGGFEVKVICPELLAIMKLQLGRARDLDDAFAILSSGNCDREKYKSYLNLLKSSLQEYKSLFEYQAFIK